MFGRADSSCATAALLLVAVITIVFDMAVFLGVLTTQSCYNDKTWRMR